MKFTVFIILSIVIISCSNKKKPESISEIMSYKEPLIGANKILVNNDSLEIASFCKHRNLKLKTDLTGLWYKIYSIGKGDSAKKDMTATIKYKVSLLSGKICYSSDSLGLKTFSISQSDVESGLKIGILKMKEGDKAKFILPPNLAYGLLGDENKIPPRSIIIYDIELIKLSN